MGWVDSDSASATHTFAAIIKFSTILFDSRVLVLFKPANLPLANKLNLNKDKYIVTYQSRLTNKWLTPFTDDVLTSLAKEGNSNILVFSPAFTADCLETIVEIGDEYNELFINSGGKNLDYVESLNYSDLWADAIISIIK